MATSWPDPVTPTRRLRVLVVDDDARVRRGLREMIDGAGDMEVVGEAPSRRHALDLDRTLEPDVLVVDVLLPLAADGLAVLREVVARGRAVVAVSVCDALASGALKAGAHSFLIKGSQAVDGLLSAIREARANHPDA